MNSVLVQCSHGCMDVGEGCSRTCSARMDVWMSVKVVLVQCSHGCMDVGEGCSRTVLE